MISSGLLFQMEPIRWIYAITFSDIFLGLGISFLLVPIWYAIYGAHSRKSSTSPPVSYNLPGLEERDFESKIALCIRQMIQSGFTYPEAHTAREISGSESLRSLLQMIEKREYMSEKLSSEERKDIRKQLENI